MADHRHARGTARPITAGPVLTGREGPAIRLRAGQRVVIVRRITPSRDHGATLGQRGPAVEPIVVAMQIIDAFRDNFALEILPGAAPDAVAGVDGDPAIRGLRAEIGPPGLAACARRLCQSLALPVRAIQSAQVGTLAEPGAGDKEGHVGCLRRRLLRPTGCRAQCDNGNRRDNGEALRPGHR